MENNSVLLEKINSGDKTAFETMVKSNMGLVNSIARRYSGRGCDMEDLIQIGSIGLIKAIKRFDNSFDVKFSTYAVPMIMGEIRKFLRDDGMIKVSRSVKETAYKGRLAENMLRQKTGREPTVKEISEMCKISCEEILYAFEACGGCSSLNEVSENSNEEIGERIISDSYEEKSIDKLFIKAALDVLDVRERKIIVMRYFMDVTQAKIAEKLNVSQVQVSRLEKKAIEKIRKQMLTQ